MDAKVLIHTGWACRAAGGWRPVACLLLALGIQAAPARAQTERQVRRSGDYYWAEARGSTLPLAREAAQAALLKAISATMQASVHTETVETASTFSQEYTAETRVFSMLQLQGVGYLDLSTRNEYRVLAYLARSDFDRSMAAVAATVEGLVEVGELAEQLGDPEAFTTYYQAYLHTFLSPHPIACRSRVYGGEVANVQALLERRLRFYLAHAELRVWDVTVDPVLPDVLTLHLEVAFNGQPVSNLILTLDAADGAPRPVRDGRVDLFRYAQPSAPRERLPMRVRMALPGGEAGAHLAALDAQYALVEVREIEADYSDRIRVDFDVQRGQAGTLTFVPVVENLSVAATAWDFGDGTRSTELRPSHRFAPGHHYPVTLTVNGSAALTVTREVGAGGESGPVPQAGSALREPAAGVATPRTDASAGVVETVQMFIEARTFGDLARRLTVLKREGRLTYGRRDVFIKPEQCYLVLVDPVTEAVTAVLAPGQPERTDLLSGAVYSALETRLQGMRAIWIEVYP